MLKIFFSLIIILSFSFQLYAEENITEASVIEQKYGLNVSSKSYPENNMSTENLYFMIKIFIVNILFFLLILVIILSYFKRKRVKIVMQDRLLNRRVEQISHALKNSLQGIVNSLYLITDSLEDKTLTNKQIEQKLELIIENTISLSKQIEESLYSLKSNFNLSDMIKSSISSHQDNFDGFDINIEYQEKSDYNYYGYKDDLKKVIDELIENSIRALLQIDREKIMTIELRRDILNYYIYVKDNGDGIEVENLNEIFKEGFTTKKKGGKGLYFAQNTIISHFNGTIKASNNNGATFEIIFPRNKKSLGKKC